MNCGPINSASKVCHTDEKTFDIFFSELMSLDK